MTNVALNIGLIPVLGLWGAVAATAAAELCFLVALSSGSSEPTEFRPGQAENRRDPKQVVT